MNGQITISGRRWDSSRANVYAAPEGLSLEHIITSSIERAYREHVYTRPQHRALLRYARCRVDGVEVPRKAWASMYPKAGARVEILHGVRGGGGGGGGKNPLATVLGVVVLAVASLVTWGVGGVVGSGFWGAMGIGTLGLGATAGAIAGGLVMIGGMMLVNALFPTPTPKLGGLGSTRDAEKISQTYSISGGRNSANVGGYVPLICGHHRFTPPLGARSWTQWEGEKQYFYMLVVWGHPNVSVWDFRIGETPLGYFRGVHHVFHQSTTGNDLAFFGQSYKEQNIGAAIKQVEGWTTRTIGEAQAISLDFQFQRGLVTIDKQNGNRHWRSVEIIAQYRILGTATWYGLGGNNGHHVFSAATQKLVIRNIRIDGLPRGVYEVCVYRVSPDTDDSYTFDDITWTTARAILYQPVFNTPIPICCSELRIQASEQLSGYVEDFNAMCHSSFPDWNGSSWVWRNTSNPASIMRYMLTSRHGLSRPYSEAKMDNAKLVELWNYCNANGYQFNFVCDTEQAVWARLVEVLAPGRAAPTTDVDGLWGVAIDRNGKTPVQLFTPRNSWGMKIQRGFAELPDALRVSFIDETDNYTQKEAYIYNDGYNASNAQNVIEWDFPGITNWGRVWQQGRMYMARSLHRQMAITINTDWEWLACHRGDLVGVASDVLMNTFGTARILRLVYDVDGVTVMAASEAQIPTDTQGNPLLPVGVELDDSIVFDEPSPARYGIAMRSNTGALTTLELAPQYGEEASVVMFAYPVQAAQVPPFGALCAVSLLGEEYEAYLVAGITPGENMGAELTLMPYKISEIEGAISGAIPPYEASVILDVVRGRTLPAPIIIGIISDESVLGGVTGASVPRIAVWGQLPPMTQDTTALRYQLRAVDVETGETFVSDASASEDMIAVSGVRERRAYDVTLRVINPTSGVASPWSAAIRHVCIGRTTPPPPPTQVFMDGSVARITQLDRPQDVVGHVVYMVFDASDPFEYAKRLTTPYTSTGTFDVAPWAGYARRLYVTAIDEIGIESTPVTVGLNLGDVLPDNVIFSISERARSWPGVVVNGSIVNDTLEAIETALLWPSDDSVSLWPPMDSLPLWQAGNAAQLVYTYNVTIPLAYAGAHVRVQPQATSGRLVSIEYQVEQYADLWNADNAAPLWPQNTDAMGVENPLWAQSSLSEWAPFPSNYTAQGEDKLTFRVTYAGGDVPAVLPDILTVIDVPDIDWAVEDLSIPVSGVHVPIPARYFRAITNLVATLQYNENDTGVTVVRMPGSLPVDDDGFLTVGPVVRVLDTQLQAVSGNADIRLKGY